MESQKPQEGERQIRQKQKTIFKKSLVLIIAVLCLLGLSLWPRQIHFAFSGSNCHDQFVFLPKLASLDARGGFKAELSDNIQLFGYPILSKKVCIKPSTAPRSGESALELKLLGALPTRHYKLLVGDEPQLSLTALDNPIPASRELRLSMSEKDEVFSYFLKANKKVAGCQSADTSLLCQTSELQLSQDKEYEVAVTREFTGESEKILAEKKVKTLKAVSIKKSSIKNKQLVFSRPKHIDISLDKPVVGAEVQLENLSKKVEVPTTVEIDDKKIRIKFEDELAREASYRLKIPSLEAKDGSDIDKEYSLRFEMSGGPEVVNLNIGSSGVLRGSVVSISLNQRIKPGQDIREFVKVSPSAAISINGKIISFTVPDVGRCGDFSIQVNKGLVSQHGIKNKKDWSHTSRTRCFDTSTIGYSANGRPVSAYYFGNGSNNILFTGAIHGDEASSSLIMHDLIQDLEVYARDLPKDKQIVIVPTVNPDGLAGGTRNNARGVNLNRNFPTANWIKDLDDTGGKVKGGGGKRALSESEAQALASLTQQLNPRLVMTYHAVGSFTMGNKAGDSSSLSARYASLVGYRDATAIGNAIFDYEVTGAYEDWLAEKLGVPNVLVELGSYSYRDFSHHRGAIWSMIRS